LFPHRTVLANVEFGLEVQGVKRAERRRAAETALDLVGLAGWESKRLDQLSGGMKQRAGLARALAADASILLMDEAFSALDPLIRRDMQAELVALQRRLRKTIVFVSHDLDEAIALGGRIALMKDGAIVQDGSAESILSAPATPYVARFVEHIDASCVLRVGTLADRAGLVGEGAPRLCSQGRLLGRADGSTCTSLPADLTLRDALPLLAAEPDGVPVVDAGGRCLGVLWRKTALNALAHRASRDDPSWTSPSPASRSTSSATARSTGLPQTEPVLPAS
jgi:glycine betaine/proline transport system ATP-binding protein